MGRATSDGGGNLASPGVIRSGQSGTSSLSLPITARRSPFQSHKPLRTPPAAWWSPRSQLTRQARTGLKWQQRHLGWEIFIKL